MSSRYFQLRRHGRRLPERVDDGPERVDDGLRRVDDGPERVDDGLRRLRPLFGKHILMSIHSVYFGHFYEKKVEKH